jgi:hypothetical protein
VYHDDGSKIAVFFELANQRPKSAVHNLLLPCTFVSSDVVSGMVFAKLFHSPWVCFIYVDLYEMSVRLLLPWFLLFDEKEFVSGCADLFPQFS